MKNDQYQALKRIVCFILVLGLFASCKKDEDTIPKLTGDVRITFLNREMFVRAPQIYAMGEYESPLIDGIAYDFRGIATVSGLNFGNYMLVYYLPGTNQTVSHLRAFQIKAGEVTFLTIE